MLLKCISTKTEKLGFCVPFGYPSTHEEILVKAKPRALENKETVVDKDVIYKNELLTRIILDADCTMPKYSTNKHSFRGAPSDQLQQLRLEKSWAQKTV